VQAVVGLGNPGARYDRTRHNLGFWVVDLLADKLDGSWSESETYLFSEVRCDDNPLLLVKPSTYMNSSGEAVVDLVERFDLDLEDVLVVVDDVHLDVGRLRFRRKGSDGGHNGLRSIMDTVGSSNFPRLRLGIGIPPERGHFIGFVLGTFDPEEIEFVKRSVLTAANSVMCWTKLGLDMAMNRYNAL